MKFQVYSTTPFRVMCNTNFSGRTYRRTDIQTVYFTGAFTTFRFTSQKRRSVDSGYSLEPRLPEYPQSVLGEKVRKYHNFSSEKF